MAKVRPQTLAPSLPPRTHRLPLFGPMAGLTSRPLEFICEMRERYGDSYTLDLGPLRVITLHSARHVQHVFVDNALNYSKGGAVWDAARKMLGNGLPVSEGTFWLRQRRMMQPYFHRQRLAGLTSQLVGATQESLQAWDAHLGQPFDMAGAFAPITMRVITRLLFGQALSKDTIDEVGAAMAYMVTYVIPGALMSGLPSWAPRPGARRFHQSLRRADAVIATLVERQRYEAIADNTLLAMLVEMVDAETGETMTAEQLRDEAVSLFLAGYETTSVALGWLFYYLISHPEVEQRLRAEIEAVLGDRPPAFEDLPRLSYTRNVICETLRLRPPVWWISRTAVEADTIDGFQIPAGALVAVFFSGVHMHPESWEAPERFEPERFEPERSVGRHKYAWVPFGAGQRQCIGKDLALMEAQVILVMILQRYQITGHVRQARVQALGTMSLKKGMTVTLRRR